MATIAFLLFVIVMSLGIITIENYISYLVILPTEILEVFYLKGVQLILTKFRYTLFVIKFLFFSVCKGTIFDIPHILEAHYPTKDCSLLENKLIHFADNRKSPSGGTSPSESSSIAPLPPGHQDYSDGESIYDSGNERSESPVDSNIDIPIQSYIYRDNSLNGTEQKLAYYTKLAERKALLTTGLCFEDDNIRKRTVMNRRTGQVLGEIIEMRNRTHGVVLLCNHVSSSFREIHVDSHSLSFPQSWIMSAGLTPNPHIVDQITLKSILMEKENASPEELKEIIKRQDECRRIKSDEMDRKREGFYQYFFEIKADFNKLEMIRVNSTISEENFPFSLTNFQYNNLTPEKKILYDTVVEAYKKQHSTEKFLSTMRNHELTPNRYVFKEIEKVLNKEIQECKITKLEALSKLRK